VNLNLTGQRAIVTGASGGIGLEVVRLLCSEGVQVIAVSRSEKSELKDMGAVPLGLDLTLPGSAAELAREAERRYKSVNFLVNCVGGVEHSALADDHLLTSDRWRRTFELNVLAPLRVAEEILNRPGLMRSGDAMVHIAGLAAHMPGASPIDYGASKAALIAISRHLAVRFGPRGIRSNTISPGPTATHLWESAAAANGISLEAFYAKLPDALGMSTGHMIAPAEIAAYAVFLLSPHAASITGADCAVSGGLRVYA
jgi:NAD(P)-dependent dehydrogenase (short-subunit alcohol dehydrogenase family)